MLMLAMYLSLLDTQAQRDKFERLYAQYKGLMFHVAFSVTNDHFSAEDIVHETFLNLIRIIDDIRIDDERETGKFLKVITHNLAVDHLRRRSKTQAWSNDALEFKATDSFPDPETVTIDKDDLERLISRIDQMEDIYRAPLFLRAQGYKVTEIAKILQINPQTVKVRLHRARKILLTELEAQANGREA